MASPTGTTDTSMSPPSPSPPASPRPTASATTCVFPYIDSYTTSTRTTLPQPLRETTPLPSLRTRPRHGDDASPGVAPPCYQHSQASSRGPERGEGPPTW